MAYYPFTVVSYGTSKLVEAFYFAVKRFRFESVEE